MNQTAIKTNTVIDPVCGMAVDPKLTNIVISLEGKDHYFCADGCRKAFEENPKKFLEPEPTKKKSLWCRYIERLEKATGGKPIKCH